MKNLGKKMANLQSVITEKYKIKDNEDGKSKGGCSGEGVKAG